MIAALIVLMTAGCSDEGLLDKHQATANEPTDESREDPNARKSGRNAFTFVGTSHTIVTSSPVQYEFLSEASATITVDWGDGITETHTSQPQFEYYSMTISHFHPENKEYVITITGDLDEIIAVENESYDNFRATEINFDKLRNLRFLETGFQALEVLDLSKNRKLERVSYYNNHLTQDIILPNNHNILQFDLTASTGLSSADLSSLIDNLYKNAVRHNTMNGFIGITEGYVEDPPILGPPSAEALEKLRILRDDYGWLIPDID